MKKAILLSLLTLYALASRAQKIELGLNGGLTPYVYADPPLKNFNGTVKREPGYYGSFRIALRLLGFQLGAAVDKFQVGVTSDAAGLKTNTKFNSLTPYLFANKIFRLPKSYIYAGINGGVNIGKAVHNSYGYVGTITDKYFGYNGGVQAGYTINFFKGLGANAEAGARYLHMQYEDRPAGVKGPSIGHLAFPVSLGIRYTF